MYRVKCAGIDIGSRTVKLVVLNDGKFISSLVMENSFDPLEVCKQMLNRFDADKIIATGFGRHLLKNYADCQIMSKISAFALGARKKVPSSRTILDIGGQDTKVISLNEKGGIRKFEMNDKCAAGTGRFLEIMAAALFHYGRFYQILAIGRKFNYGQQYVYGIR
jgi:predicted CoA-substrate-specific enzyme activase